MPARTGAPTLVFDQAAQPPFDRFIQLCEDREAKRAWEHKRPDLPDQEILTYEAALANVAVQAGWTDQEVANLLIAHRRKYFEDPINGSHFAEVIHRAKAGGGGKEEPANRGDGEIDAQALLSKLNRALGLSIMKVTQYGAGGGTYELLLKDGRQVDLGPALNVLNHRLTKGAIAQATTVVIPPFKQVLWDRLAEAIFKCAGLAPIEEAPETQETNWWIRACVQERTVLDIEESDRAGLAGILRDRAGVWAFRNKNAQILIHLGGFLKDLNVRCSARPTWKEAALRLRKIRFTPRDLEGKDSAGKVRVNVWMSSRGWHLGE
jgi:hypothetical protein